MEHKWELGGPWYRWPRPGLPADGRLSVPEIQKYAHGKFVQSFVENPQRSLRFDTQKDFRQAGMILPPANGIMRRIGDVLASAKGWSGQKIQERVPFKRKEIAEDTLLPSGLLKLYQPVHERFYLVVAELHCDAPGYPSPEREKICSAHFVIRRRRTEISSTDAKVFGDRLQSVQEARRNLEIVTRDTSQETQENPKGGIEQKLAHRVLTEGKLEALHFSLASLEEMRAEKGIVTQLQRWVGLDPADPGAKVGAWRNILQGKEKLLHDQDDGKSEHVLPMHRAYADPGNEKHDASGRAIYFGVIPTVCLQHDAQGDDRLDSDDVYEIQCFVRRRKVGCQRLPGSKTCSGEVIWSKPTRPFCVAAAMDLEGMANRPVTIRMPDLKDLQAQISQAKQPSQFATMAFEQPQDLVTGIDTWPLKKTDNGPGPSTVCFFAIPLVTIIALFIIKMVLPMIMLIFQLWWLLALKFCLPPTLKIDANLAATLGAIPSDFNVSAQVKIDLDKALKGALPATMIAEMSVEDKATLLSTVRDHHPGAKTGSDVQPQGRTGRFIQDDFYEPVTPLWPLKDPMPARRQELTT